MKFSNGFSRVAAENENPSAFQTILLRGAKAGGNSAAGLAHQPHPPTIAHSKMNRNIFCRICFHFLNYFFCRVLRKSVKNSTTRARIKNVFIHLHNKIMRVCIVNFDGLPLLLIERGKFNENSKLAISVHLKTAQVCVVIHENKHNSIL